VSDDRQGARVDEERDRASGRRTSGGVHSRRVIFIDLGRALAVTFMLYGHTASALLAPEYQTGRWFAVWQFQRGLTSSLFLLLGGFAFSIATSRHWAAHTRFSPAVVKRLRRFGLFVLLGYALHLPVSRLRDLGAVPDDRWRMFLAVDVLQLVGVTLLLVQLLVFGSRSRQTFTLVTFALAFATILATPFLWLFDWTPVLPLAAAAYLTPAAGSLFPLFPWMAFVLLGAGFGQIYARWGAAHLPVFTRRALLVPGAVMLGTAVLLRILPVLRFGSGPGDIVPSEVLLRAGSCLVILAVIAYLSRRITRLPHVFGAVAQESLLIYFVHLCIVYGSVWNRGLAQTYGATMPPGQTLVMVVMVIVSMVALAWYWNWFKHVRPRLAQWTSIGVGGFLLYRLL
jgi:uncharacterized membrane protein